MKRFVLFSLSIYQRIFSPLVHMLTGTAHACRYEVSCSRFAVLSIEKHGVVKGGYFAIRRVLSCHPFAKVSYDQV